MSWKSLLLFANSSLSVTMYFRSTSMLLETITTEKTIKTLAAYFLDGLPRAINNRSSRVPIPVLQFVIE